jgi:hypothetical protein
MTHFGRVELRGSISGVDDHSDRRFYSGFGNSNFGLEARFERTTTFDRRTAFGYDAFLDGSFGCFERSHFGTVIVGHHFLGTTCAVATTITVATIAVTAITVATIAVTTITVATIAVTAITVTTVTVAVFTIFAGSFGLNGWLLHGNGLLHIAAIATIVFLAILVRIRVSTIVAIVSAVIALTRSHFLGAHWATGRGRLQVHVGRELFDDRSAQFYIESIDPGQCIDAEARIGRDEQEGYIFHLSVYLSIMECAAR